MNEQNLRSDCPVNYGVEAFGDKWSLLILRDVLFYGKKTYGEFLKSEEGIATNILANRLLMLEQEKLLIKAPHKIDKRKDTYTATQKTLDLLPMLLELVRWSKTYGSDIDAPTEVVDRIATDREQLIAEIKEGILGKRTPLLLDATTDGND